MEGAYILSSHILACLCPAQMEGGEFREAIPSPGRYLTSPRILSSSKYLEAEFQTGAFPQVNFRVPG